MLSRLAGVTFKNDPQDGGRSRQDILKDFVDCGRHILTVDLIYTEYNNEFAIKVKDHTTKQVLGYIPKSDLDKISSQKIRQMTAFIRFYKNCYSVQLDRINQPTKEQYCYMKHICEENNLAMPAYDKRAYAEIFALVARQTV